MRFRQMKIDISCLAHTMVTSYLCCQGVIWAMLQFHAAPQHLYATPDSLHSIEQSSANLLLAIT